MTQSVDGKSASSETYIQCAGCNQDFSASLLTGNHLVDWAEGQWRWMCPLVACGHSKNIWPFAPPGAAVASIQAAPGPLEIGVACYHMLEIQKRIAELKLSIRGYDMMLECHICHHKYQLDDVQVLGVPNAIAAQ